MKIVIHLVVAALLVNACVRGGDAVWRNFQLQEATTQAARRGNHRTVAQLLDQVLLLASEHGVHLEPDEVLIEARGGGLQTHVSFEYVERIPVLPEIYTRVQTFEVTVDVQPLRPLRPEKPRR
jgi:hypothetical protein